MEATKNIKHICGFCHREFVRETSLSVHLCEPKRRHSEREEAGVRIGFNTWLRFYEITQGSNRNRSWDEFVESSYYKAFVRFGRHAVAIRAVNTTAFADWLIQHNRKIDHWCRDTVYGEWLSEYICSESMTDGLSRTLETAIEWAEKNHSTAEHMLRYGNANQISYLISTGRISPWVLYNTESGTKFLQELNTENIATIWPMINSDLWQKRFRDYAADSEYVRQILTQAGW